MVQASPTSRWLSAISSRSLPVCSGRKLVGDRLVGRDEEGKVQLWNPNPFFLTVLLLSVFLYPFFPQFLFFLIFLPLSGVFLFSCFVSCFLLSHTHSGPGSLDPGSPDFIFFCCFPFFTLCNSHPW